MASRIAPIRRQAAHSDGDLEPMALDGTNHRAWKQRRIRRHNEAHDP